MIKKAKGIALFALGVFALYSCSKSSSSPSTSADLVGSWKQTAEDTGVNNVAIPTDTSWAHEIITFNSNNTFSESYYSYTAQGAWALSSNNSYLTVVDTSSGFSSTSSLQIVSISSSTMKLKDTTSGSVSVAIFTKQ